MVKAKSVQDVAVQYTVPGEYIEQRIEQSVREVVRGAVEARVSDAVADAVGELVDEVGRKRIGAEVEKVLADGWQIVNNYGESAGGRKTLKDRIGEILNHKDSYSSRSWLDEFVKTAIGEAINKDLKKDIDAAREKFKSEVDSVLTGVIKKAIAGHFGVKQ